MTLILLETIPDFWTKILDSGLTILMMATIGYFGFKFLNKQLEIKDTTIKEKDDIIENINNYRVEDLKTYLDILSKVNTILDKVLIENSATMQQFVKEASEIKSLIAVKFDEVSVMLRK